MHCNPKPPFSSATGAFAVHLIACLSRGNVTRTPLKPEAHLLHRQNRQALNQRPALHFTQQPEKAADCLALP